MAFAFEWDPEKAASNLVKHRVSFEEAATAFADPHGLIVPDPRHSQHEERLVLLGHSSLQRLLAIMFTERGDRLGLISARKATPTEHRTYEEAAP